MPEKIVSPLKKMPDCPIPDPAAAGYVTCRDGVRLRYGRWHSPANVHKGTIIYLQGRAEFIEKGYETYSGMMDHGFDVLTFDWRGQGGSDRLLENRRKGYVDEFEEYVLDLETIIQDIALPDCKAPLFIVAHSLGALVALMAAPRIPNKVRRLVLCSPFLAMGELRFSQKTVKLLTGGLSAFGLGDLYVNGDDNLVVGRSFEGNGLTSDKVRFTRFQDFLRANPEFAIGGPTANWVFAACKAVETVADPDFYTDITIPALFVIAGNDKVVDNRASELLASRLRAATTLTIDGAQHELFQESDYFREQCLAAIYAYIPGTG